MIIAAGVSPIIRCSTNNARIAEAGRFNEKAKQFELKADYLLEGDTWHHALSLNRHPPIRWSPQVI